MEQSEQQRRHQDGAARGVASQEPPQDHSPEQRLFGERRRDDEQGHRDTSAALIGNIAHKLRSFLEWDPKGERFTNNDAANKFLKYDYRKPYELPG